MNIFIKTTPNRCNSTFLTFSGLRKHMKTCIKNRIIDCSSSVGPVEESTDEIEILSNKLDVDIHVQDQVPITLIRKQLPIYLLSL